ncbi:MAG: hypothetical protein AUJ98_09725 [Bacteroidetes bacterium CG2_30_33_31]|nr:MAG: hypothetical protein AUJ98_09725 [Bacteroidetes bacterium CG2_30_33_31]
MKIGFRIPSITKRISARTSVSRVLRQNMGLKMPNGYGWVSNPKKFLYNKVYNKTSKGCLINLAILITMPFLLLFLILIIL